MNLNNSESIATFHRIINDLLPSVVIFVGLLNTFCLTNVCQIKYQIKYDRSLGYFYISILIISYIICVHSFTYLMCATILMRQSIFVEFYWVDDGGSFDEQ